MAEGFQCGSPPAFCADAHALLTQAGGSMAAAERLARDRGHSRLSIVLAKRYCR